MSLTVTGPRDGKDIFNLDFYNLTQVPTIDVVCVEIVHVGRETFEATIA